MSASGMTRRSVLTGLATSAAVAGGARLGLAAPAALAPSAPLEEFDHSQVKINGSIQNAQRENVTGVLMALDEDSLLKPFRAMGGFEAPGTDLGGWYGYRPGYDPHHDEAGLAPGSNFGQWTSALARLYAASTFDKGAQHDDLRERVLRLHSLLDQSISPGAFSQTRFPAYNLDKLTCGLMDAHRLLHDDSALAKLERIRQAALPSLPGRAVDREIQWKLGADETWLWDETYTLPENLYLVSSMGGGPAYRQMAEDYLLNKTFFEPLARGENVLGDHHAYSYVNSLCSAMQASLTGGSKNHLQAAVNAFGFLQQQAWVTGGWGPEELLRKPGYDEMAKHLVAGHNGFETPCGSYAHMKLTRYLLRATRDGQYGDSMERVFFNTILGALPMLDNGSCFYSSDYNYAGRRVYSVHRWPCCSGTMPQVVADYGINSYLREAGALWVNLYQPSQVRWTEGATRMEVQQSGTYPEDGRIVLQVRTSSAIDSTICLRIPQWAGASALVKINGVAQRVVAEKGFARLHRRWRDGDLIDLTLPMNLRLETIPANGTAHPETQALLYGPVVLFALREPGDVGPLQFKGDALLKAERTGAQEWTANALAGPRRLVPFPYVGLNAYSTYGNLV